MDAIEKTNHVDEALELMLNQDKEKPYLEALISALVASVQTLEAEIFRTYESRFIDNATYAQLDIIGRIVGQPRGTLSDNLYRRYIKARIAVNRSNGKIPELLNILRIISDPGETYRLREFPFASIVLEINTEISESPDALALVETIHNIIDEARSAGVGVQTTWSHQEAIDRFKLSSQVDAIDSSSTQGLANSSQTTGGHFRGVMG